MNSAPHSRLTAVALLGALCFAPWAAAETHHIASNPKTIVRGYFDATVPPVQKVKSGDTVEIDTWTAGGAFPLESAGLARDKVPAAMVEYEQTLKPSEHSAPHLLTGPVYVEGAEPGDVLEVKILNIDLTLPYAWNAIFPSAGFLPWEFPYERWKLTPLDLDRKVGKFAEGIEIPLRPFFGVIGVAPPPGAGKISSGPPWLHSGNMDNKDLVAGTTLYMPVHVPGALFSVGDGHAAQGDGEVCVTALETSLRGIFQLTVHKNQKLRWPRADTPTHFITMGFHPNLEEATKIAVLEMLDYLVTEKHMDRDQAYFLASVAVDLHITQLVDGNKGVHAMLPKAIFVKKN
jgi:acetamidase/formamidase